MLISPASRPGRALLALLLLLSSTVLPVLCAAVSPRPNPYKILNVDVHTRNADLTRAFRYRFYNAATATEKRQALEAWLTLVDEAARCRYHLATGTSDWYGRPLFCSLERFRDLLIYWRNLLAPKEWQKTGGGWGNAFQYIPGGQDFPVKEFQMMVKERLEGDEAEEGEEESIIGAWSYLGVYDEDEEEEGEEEVVVEGPGEVPVWTGPGKAYEAGKIKTRPGQTGPGKIKTPTRGAGVPLATGKDDFIQDRPTSKVPPGGTTRPVGAPPPGQTEDKSRDWEAWSGDDSFPEGSQAPGKPEADWVGGHIPSDNKPYGESPDVYEEGAPWGGYPAEGHPPPAYPPKHSPPSGQQPAYPHKEHPSKDYPPKAQPDKHHPPAYPPKQSLPPGSEYPPEEKPSKDRPPKHYPDKHHPPADYHATKYDPYSSAESPSRDQAEEHGWGAGLQHLLQGYLWKDTPGGGYPSKDHPPSKDYPGKGSPPGQAVPLASNLAFNLVVLVLLVLLSFNPAFNLAFNPVVPVPLPVPILVPPAFNPEYNPAISQSPRQPPLPEQANPPPAHPPPASHPTLYLPQGTLPALVLVLVLVSVMVSVMVPALVLVPVPEVVQVLVRAVVPVLVPVSPVPDPYLDTQRLGLPSLAVPKTDLEGPSPRMRGELLVVLLLLLDIR
ncbi:hypothetical protein QBC47DRAFT_417357 [Echria macrotheca]|uniref:Uncharacterized protein n=1 Tax=Echria macrotheca TaxID=438768 RepID=A0AAJ0B4B8_9PEZI|nr:hypothetical protein QBC47DRAFT_417357 [Echria macrotheca]